jgi:hypothetical protein
MERLVRRVLFCALMLLSTLVFAQQLTVTAGNHGRCDASWELDSPPLHTLEGPWGTVDLGKGRDSGKEWKGSTPSGIAVTVFPEGKYGKGTLVQFSFAVCQRVTVDDNGKETAYILTPKPLGYWYLEPKGSYALEKKSDELETAAFSSGHGLDVKLLPAKAPAPAPASTPKKGSFLKSGPEKWKFDVVMTCKDGKCVTPAGVPVRDTLP